MPAVMRFQAIQALCRNTFTMCVLFSSRQLLTVNLDHFPREKWPSVGWSEPV